MKLPARLPGKWVIFLLALFIFPGTVYRALWKGDDAVYAAASLYLLKDGGWLVPKIGATLLPDPAYLYTWVGALFGGLFSWLVGGASAVLLASVFFSGLMFWFVYLTRRELSADNRADVHIAVLILASCLGLALPIHLAYPVTALLATLSMTLYGLALLPRQPWKGALVAGLGLVLTALSDPLVIPVLVLFSFLLPFFMPHWRRTALVMPAIFSFIAALLLMAGWWWLLMENTPRVWSWDILFGAAPPGWARFLDALGILISWFAWPALPAALWSLWVMRRQVSQPQLLFPLLFVLLWLMFLGLHSPGESYLLPILIPLSLIAAPGMERLSRNQSQTYNWFAQVFFSFVILLLWVGWFAQYFGVPRSITYILKPYEPTFIASLRVFPLIIAILGTVAWWWVIFTTSRSPTRGVIHWALGMILCWLLAVCLWQPWFDVVKSYRNVVMSMKKSIKLSDGSCVLKRGLGLSQEASFYAYGNIEFQPWNANSKCRLLLLQEGEQQDSDNWRLIWSGRRAGDFRENYRLYRQR